MTGIGHIQAAPSGDTGGQTGTTDQLTAWERGTRRWAFVFAALTLAVSVLIALVVIRAGRPAAITLFLALAPAFGVYAWQTGKIRRRHAILREPFPPEWEAVLQRDVVFFRVLGPAEQRRFRRQLQVFLGEKQITGIGVKADTTTRVLAGASAIIPIFGFPDWEWDVNRACWGSVSPIRLNLTIPVRLLLQQEVRAEMRSPLHSSRGEHASRDPRHGLTEQQLLRRT